VKYKKKTQSTDIYNQNYSLSQQRCHRQAVLIVLVAKLLLYVRGLIYAKPFSRTDVL